MNYILGLAGLKTVILARAHLAPPLTPDQGSESSIDPEQDNSLIALQATMPTGTRDLNHLHKSHRSPRQRVFGSTMPMDWGYTPSSEFMLVFPPCRTKQQDLTPGPQQNNDT